MQVCLVENWKCLINLNILSISMPCTKGTGSAPCSDYVKVAKSMEETVIENIESFLDISLPTF